MPHLRAFSGLAVAGLALGALVSACDDDPSSPGNGPGEQELINEITITLTPVGGGAAISATITDPDGAGPEPPEPPTQT